MPRLMSVAYTKDQVRARTKTVTRRAGWATAKPGDVLELCEKVMGRRKGEPLVRICRVLLVDVRRESLAALTDDLAYGFAETAREGFPGMHPAAFVQRYFTDAQSIPADAVVTRIEWEYLETCEGCQDPVRVFVDEVSVNGGRGREVRSAWVEHVTPTIDCAGMLGDLTGPRDGQ